VIDDPRRKHVELIAVSGNPTPKECIALERALDHVIEADRQARSPSVWLRAGRGQGRRLGMYDYRDRFRKEDAWRLSLRFPPGGREYPGLTGRGDAK